MPTKAKLYIGFVTALGVIILAGCSLAPWQTSDMPRFLSYLLLAVICSVLKIKLPGVTGTISINFLFILIGVAELTFSETVVMASAGALVQCVFRTRRLPKAVQVVFNAAVLGVSSATAFWASRLALNSAGSSFLPLVLAVASGVFFVTNTLLVAAVLSLVEAKPLLAVWQQCYLWSFPYYLAGALLAALISYSSRIVGWEISLLMLPLMYLVYTFYRLFVDRVAPQQAHVPLKVAA